MAAETMTDELPKSDTIPPTKTTKKAATGNKRASTPRKKKTTRRTPKKAATPAAAAPPSVLMLPREVGGLCLIALALGILLSLVSFQPQDVQPATEQVSNLIGPVGAHIANLILAVLGLGAFCLDALLWYLGVMILLGRRPDVRPASYVGQLFFVLSGTILAHLIMGRSLFFGHSAGGAIGEFLAELARGGFGTVGAYMIATVMLIMSMMFVLHLSLSAITRWVAERVHRAVAYIKHQFRVYLAYRQRFAQERQRLLQEQYKTDEPAVAHAQAAVQPIGPSEYAFEAHFEDQVESKLTNKLHRLFGKRGATPEPEQSPKPARKTRAKTKKAPAPTPVTDEVETATTPPAAPMINGKSEEWSLGDPLPVADNEPNTGLNPDVTKKSKKTPDVDDASSITMQVDDADVVDMTNEGQALNKLGDQQGDFGPKIIERSKEEQERRIKQLLERSDGEGILLKTQSAEVFELPKLSYLNYEEDADDSVDIETLRTMAAQIEQTLRDFKVEGTIQNICPGPVITVFEFSPAAGVKISKIANLSDDLAMALSALSVRIVAPIPGKGVVGIEVPNPKREIVYMKEIIADDTFIADTKMALPMGLGKDTAGDPIVTDLAKMPHLLVAGATGSGKSVAVNTMITSLLYKNSPENVRLIMVDPKMLEFSIYADIPHLLLPVVTDPKQATVALNWAVQEMERRYQALAELNVRNIKGYNEKVDKLFKQAELDMAEGKDDSKAVRTLSLDAEGNPSHKNLPYIVVIIDEFADLMMTASKDVETAVARLAQKARAAGIHLILATQRPSTDVITGLIKANFPTRIALRVTSKTDSRVILDNNGAENLLGNGDMLFVPPGSSYIQRVHGAYVSEKEIDLIVEHLKEQGKPQYDESILVEEDEDGDNVIDDADRDEYYKDAVRLVVESRQASISMIQRKLRVGYNRAARMVEMMETESIVSPPDGCKPREVLLDHSPY